MIAEPFKMLIKLAENSQAHFTVQLKLLWMCSFSQMSDSSDSAQALAQRNLWMDVLTPWSDSQFPGMCGLSLDGKKRLRALWQHSQKCHRTNGKITLTQSDFPAGCEFGDCRDQCNRSPALPQSLQHSFAENTTLPTVPRADAERALHGLLPQHHVRLPGWYSRSWCPLVELYPAPWRSSQEPWVEHVALSMCCWASIPLFVTLWDRLRSTGQNDLSR